MNSRLRVMTFFGTRPEAIKMAPLVRELQSRAPGVESIVCVSAQHRQMLDQVLRIFDITPDYDLDLMRPNQSLADLTARALTEITPVLRGVRPDVVLVQGDTTTAMVGALAAFYERIPVGHVEAGLRTDDRYSPFPEEMNRRMVGSLATMHFAPTLTAADALRRHGIAESDISVTGNTVVDALQHIVRSTKAPATTVETGDRRLVLLTAHRRENFGEPLSAVFRAVRRLVERLPDVEVVYPVHPNPSVASAAHATLAGVERVHLVEPLDYVSFLHTLSRSTLVLTDSGGIQEEAPALGKPVLVLRNETERPEGVQAGAARLVGNDEETILREATRLLTDPVEYASMAQARQVYGDGTAARRIVDILQDRLISPDEPGVLALAGA